MQYVHCLNGFDSEEPSISLIGKLNLSCDVIVANNCSHQVIVFE